MQRSRPRPRAPPCRSRRRWRRSPQPRHRFSRASALGVSPAPPAPARRRRGNHDETVAVTVIGGARPCSASWLKPDDIAPMASNRTDMIQSQILAAAGKHHILLAPLDRFHRIADAMVRGGAGGRDRIVHALDLEPGAERGGGRTGRHRLGDANGPTRLGLFPWWVKRGSTMVRVGRPARAHDDAGAFVGNVARLDAGSRIACSMATWFQPVPRARNRMARRSTVAAGSRAGCAMHWQRNPSVA